MERHRYNVNFMNSQTGKCRSKLFYGEGETEADCKKSAMEQARAKARDLSRELYEKAQAKNRSPYALSRECYKFDIVYCGLDM